ncbi:hypothetical protein [Cytophaga aurantiaca]|uniref:hypothetical protein n=1 Tax=Cytophaga aurantiaca TaxID=29530 RepID=UPI0012F877E6|nr:hypothetical protein [Cytophaga aurantiaca]
MDADTIIERRQKYFHLFWIPFFPIGQVWVIKKNGSSDFYEPSSKMNKHLNALDLKYNTPWYTFTLLLAAIVTIATYFSFVGINSYYNNKFRELELAEKENKRVEKEIELLSAVSNGKPDTYFILNDSNSATTSCLKVISSDATTLTCLISQIDRCTDYNYCALEAFATNENFYNEPFDSVVVTKADLIHSYKNGDEKILMHYLPMRLTGFLRIDHPVFIFNGVNYKNGKYKGTFKNIGAAITQIKFKQDNKSENNLLLDTASIKKNLKTGEKFVLIGTYTGSKPILSGNLFFLNQNNEADTCILFVDGLNENLTRKSNSPDSF